MAPPKLEITPEQMAEAQRLYEEARAPLHEIAARLGLSRDTLRNRIHEWGWVRRRHPRGARDADNKVRVAANAAVAEAPSQVLPQVAPERRAALAGIIVDTVEDQMNAVQRVLAIVQPKDHAEAEQSTRMIASVSQILRDTVALFPSDKTTHHADDPDDIPRDIDEFREALARRINAFVDAHAGEAEGTPEDPGDPGDQAL
ncbi:MAG TPA: hypothetical protein VG986_09305 [Pseudolabrys sp.]|nr:hypothetical protein [Pseudolabrys sp.]